MRIAFFVDSYKPDLSGVVVSIDTFARELKDLGHEIFIFAPRMGDYLDSDHAVIRVPSIRAPLNNLQKYYLMRPHLFRESRIIQALRPHIIHTHTPFSAGILGDLLAKRLHIPLVTTYHTLLTEYCHYIPLPQDVLKRMAVQTSRWYCNRADGVIAPSESIQELLEEYGVTSPVRIIPTGIDLKAHRNGSRDEYRHRLGIPEGATVLMYMGRVAHEKNLPFLFRVYRELFARHPGLLALVAGGGPELDSVRSLARQLGIADRIIFPGMIPKEETPHYYACGDIFTFASQTETQGLVVAEAMAAGLPVVLVKAMGVTEMARHGIDGFLTPPDEAEFAAAVEKLLDPALRQKMSAQAFERAEAFSSTRMTLKMVEFYEEILATKAARRRRSPRRIVI